MTTQLVTSGLYATWTGDAATDPTAVDAALLDAQNAADQHCRRHFAFDTYTEILYVYRDGKVYPTNTPLATVIDPPIADTALQGNSAYLGVFLPTPAYINAGDWLAGVPPQAQVTYTGGYQAYGTTDGATPALPVAVARAIARIAYLALHPSSLSGLPAGIRSATVGGVSVSGDLSAFETIDPGIVRALKGYQKRQAHGWQSS